MCLQEEQQDAEAQRETAAAQNEQVSWTAYIDCPIGNGTAQSELTDELIQSAA